MVQDVENPKGEEKMYRWVNFVLLEPELVEIKTDMLTGTQTFELIPTEELKALVSSTRPEDQERVEKLKESSPELVNAIMEHRNIKLDENCVSMIADLTDPSASRGTSPIQCLFKCLSGDTKVAFLDGTNPTLEELCNSGAKDFWVYSVNPETQEVVPCKALGVMYMGDKELLEVTIDNGSVIKCTPDHKFMLRDGSYQEAQKLKAGDSLMPLYRRYDNQYEKINKNTSIYEKIYNPGTEKWTFTHVLSVLANKREETKGKGKYVIHHQNVHNLGGENKPFYSLDNTPENLLVLSKADHTSLHRKYSATPERMKEIAIQRHIDETPEDKERFSQIMKANWADPEWKAKNIESRKRAWANADPEARALRIKKSTEAMKATVNKKMQKRLVELQKISSAFVEKNNRLPTIEELASLYNIKIPTLYWTIKKFGSNVIGVFVYPTEDNPVEKNIAVLNHKVVSVIRTGKVEKVYDVINAGSYHNFCISFDDKSGVVVKNCLILQDWIRLAQSAYAQNYVFPKELWTIGDLASNTMPSEQDISNWKNLINQSIQNPPFSIFAPPIVKYEPLSVMGKQFPLNAEYDYIQDQLLVGMGVNKNVILGEGPNFGNSKTMALHALVMQYKTVRDKFEDWMLNHFFRPIAEKNNFYTVDPATGKKELILPQISWFKSLDIEDEDAEKERFIELHEKGLISTKTLFSKFPELDFETERQNLEQERGTIFDKGGGKDRIPAKISKPSGGGEVGAGGGMGGEMPEPVEPIEPIEPGEEGAEGVGEVLPGEVGQTPEMVEAPEGGAAELAMPER